jgi:DNA replication protein DnaC
MPSASTSLINKTSENNEQRQSTSKNNENQVKSNLGANIVLIGAPGSGKLFLFENRMLQI